MTLAIIMIIISSLLGTQLLSPFFACRFFAGVNKYRKQDVTDTKKKKPLREFVDFEMYSPVAFWVIQIIALVIGLIIFSLWYTLELPDFTFSEFLATGWLIGIIHLISWLITIECDVFGYGDSSNLFDALAMFFSITLLALSLIFNIASGCYSFFNQAQANTFIKEAEIPVVNIDVLQSISTETVFKGYSFENAIYRDGRVIVPMSRGENVEIAGYVEIKDNLTPQVVLKTLRYTPYNTSTHHPEWVARQALPSKIFFGGWSFQLTPEGDVYFVQMYGTHAWLRGGRNIQGIVMVNAEDGSVSTCSLSDAPNWIEGISE